METFQHITSLPTNGRIIAEYIWLGGNLLDIRSKCMTIPEDSDLTNLPEWNYDGSSTNQASGKDSEILIRPRRIFPDPFRQGKHILVLCETFNPNGSRTLSNFRDLASQILSKCKTEKPWFGIEQEYVLYRKDTTWPLGFPLSGFPKPQGPYYCGVGADAITLRGVMETHLRACLYCGINISGTNAEVMPGQWEFQVGPSEGIDAGDEMWMARYLLLRVGEIYGVTINWDPKPIESGHWNGSGCHTNFSTAATRTQGGYDVISAYIEKLKITHEKYIGLTGVDNHKRLSGNCETSDLKIFSHGVADRGASIRIPRKTEADKMGYLEDRRPAANMDPYVITAALADITCLNGENLDLLIYCYKEYLGNLKGSI